MKPIIYHTQNKSHWGTGPWQSEPDKIQYIDKYTKYPCLIVRSLNVGHLCGYVGVSQNHILYGKSYNDEELYSISIHGGLTFSHSCQEISPKTYEEFKKRLEKLIPESQKYPFGDAANHIKTWTEPCKTYETFKSSCEAKFICHVSEAKDDIWWFGFDCGHAGDFSPEVFFHLKQINPLRYRLCSEEYRDISYVKSEIKSLAKQLKELQDEIPQSFSQTSDAP